MPKNGFATCCCSAVPSARNCGSSWLMFTRPSLLPPKPEVIAARAHVADRQRGVAAGKLALEIDRPLLDARRLPILVDEVDVVADAGEQAERVPDRLRQASGKRLVETAETGRGRAGNQAGAHVVGRHRRIPNLTVVGRVRPLVVPRRVERAVTGAQHGRAVQRPRRTDARREPGLRRIALRGGKAVLPGVPEPAAQIKPGQRRQRADRGAVERDREVILLLLEARLVFVAESVIEREVGRNAEIVLRVTGVVAHEHAQRRRDRNRAHRCRVGGRIAEQQAGQPRAGVGPGNQRIRSLRELAIEEEIAARLSRQHRIDADLAVVAAELQRVAPDRLRDRAVEARRAPRPQGCRRVAKRPIEESAADLADAVDEAGRHLWRDDLVDERRRKAKRRRDRARCSAPRCSRRSGSNRSARSRPCSNWR